MSIYRAAADAAEFLGDAVVAKTCGRGGLSGATMQQLEALVAQAIRGGCPICKRWLHCADDCPTRQ